MSSLQKKLFNSKGLPPKPSVPSSHKSFQRQPRDYSATSWSEYFDLEDDVRTQENKNVFHYYKTGSSGPLIVFMHGGGFSGLSWALLSKTLTKLVHCQCVAFDQRGHGMTKCENEDNLSADQLASDVEEFLLQFLEKNETLQSQGVILVGHSMGGAIATHASAKHKVPNLVGLVVIDVVEGSALESLHAMQGVLQNRPRTFESIERANEWCVRTGYVRNLESAKVSMVGQLKKLDEPVAVTSRHHTIIDNAQSMNSIAEDEESSSTNNSSNSQPARKFHHYGWRIDLSKTSKYWKGWFEGMSSTFLSVPVPKILMLAGIDRLDTQLTAAQMQGKFQMQVLSKSGHAVHEDVPDKVAEAIASFLVRHRFAEAASDFKRPFPAC